MIASPLPSRDEMMRAFLGRDARYEGVFVTAVRTTGIFCRPTCPARKPNVENVEFFATARDALFAGYRPCRRCAPLTPAGAAPDWLRPLLDRIDAEPDRRIPDRELRAAGLSPERVRRWFLANHGMTFQGYCRSRRLGAAMRQIGEGSEVTDAALDQGWESLSAFNDAVRRVFGAPPTAAAKEQTVLLTRRMLTPLGPMVACATDEALCLLEFSDRRMLERQLRRIGTRLKARPVPGTNPILSQLEEELARYFDGALRTFTVPLAPVGSEYQHAVWARLRRIPYGTTTSYGALAADLGRPTHPRAVARANGDNAIAILIPCHRVIGADGSLTGYGGGLWRKQRLLEHEGAIAPRLPLE